MHALMKWGTFYDMHGEGRDWGTQNRLLYVWRGDRDVGTAGRANKAAHSAAVGSDRETAAWGFWGRREEYVAVQPARGPAAPDGDVRWEVRQRVWGMDGMDGWRHGAAVGGSIDTGHGTWREGYGTGGCNGTGGGEGNKGRQRRIACQSDGRGMDRLDRESMDRFDRQRRGGYRTALGGFAVWGR